MFSYIYLAQLAKENVNVSQIRKKLWYNVYYGKIFHIRIYGSNSMEGQVTLQTTSK